MRKMLMVVLLAVGMLFVASGCKKKEPSTLDQLKREEQKTGEEAKKTADEAAKDASKELEDATK